MKAERKVAWTAALKAKMKAWRRGEKWAASRAAKMAELTVDNLAVERAAPMAGK